VDNFEREVRNTQRTVLAVAVISAVASLAFIGFCCWVVYHILLHFDIIA